MANAGSNPKLLFALAAALVAALMVIAFLIGRESGRNTARDTEAAVHPLPPVPELAPKAGMGGATSGFDRLIADTDRMAAELQSVTPPPSCQGYHQATLEALVQTRDLIDGMKVAIVAHDVRALGAVAQEAAALQNQAEALKALEKAIRASAQ